MGVCSLCRPAIPGTALPAPPKGAYFHGDDGEAVRHERDSVLHPMTDASWAQNHHGSPAALAASSRACALCRFIEELVRDFVARRPADQRHRYDCYEVKVARRPYPGDGFLMFLWLGPSKQLYLAAAVGFCADYGERFFS